MNVFLPYSASSVDSANTKLWKIFIICLCVGFPEIVDVECKFDPQKSIIWGPGLHPNRIVLPARYFFIKAMDSDGLELKKSPENHLTVKILNGSADYANECRVPINIFDRKDGTFIVRYKMYYSCGDIQIHVKYINDHVADSPYFVPGPVHPEDCYCPEQNFDEWFQQYKCETNYEQIFNDLRLFSNVHFPSIRKTLLSRFNSPGSISMCHYAVKNNNIFRQCFGQHTGFKMFMDAILLSLARKVILPDSEFFVNLGDWPLIKKTDNVILPMFSWCGSDDTLDIVMPTYDITESTLENMGRVTLDMLSVQGKTNKIWKDKVEKAFWRGRDSRRERLNLIDIARKNPDLFNASLTNFFFFRDEMDKYGPKENPVSFFEYFDYKYQINIDGTVAAYRLPYLLAGGSVVFKQDSKYYEHFYKKLVPWVHYIPFKRDLSDLVERVLWAKKNDGKAEEIAQNAVLFAQENLMPHNIMCYHAVLLNEWSQKLMSSVEILKDMEHVPQPKLDSRVDQCLCQRLMVNSQEKKDEL